MKFASFEIDGESGYGLVSGDKIVRLDGDPNAPTDLKTFLGQRSLTGCMQINPGVELDLASVRLLPPIPNPGKVICVATNFHEPARHGQPDPEYPLLFTRFAESLTGHESPLMKPSVSERFDFEGEVAVVIGRAGYRIPPEAAMDHVAGYSCFNDGSVRDWQKHSSQFTAGKNFWRSGGFGPWLVCTDEIPDPSQLNLETRVNGAVKQSVALDRFIFDIPWLIAYITTFTPLAPGDVIVTGTPSGFGSSRQPAEFLSDGDVVEVEVAGLGTLRNTVRQARG